MKSLLARANRLLRLQQRGHWTLVMRDGSRRIMSRAQATQAFQDAASGIDTPDARVVLRAVTEDSGGKMLELVKAVRNSVET